MEVFDPGLAKFCCPEFHFYLSGIISLLVVTLAGSTPLHPPAIPGLLL